jgi:phage-related protein
MWETIKNALSGVKEATGIEIPGLPADLGSIGESATTALQSVTGSVTDSATGVIDGAASATEALTGGAGGLADTAAAATEAATEGVTGVSEAATTAVDSASQSLPDITGGLVGGSPEK